MNYFGVAHLFFDNPELLSLRLFKRSHTRLSVEQEQTLSESLISDIAINQTPRINPQDAWDDAVALCESTGLEPGYAMIKREDGHYFTSVDEATNATV